LIPFFSSAISSTTMSSTPETREKVVHNYADRSTEPDPEPEGGKDGQPAAGMDHNFPMKLHYMLSSIEGDGQGHIVSWQVRYYH
jgi:hypothetical protein